MVSLIIFCLLHPDTWGTVSDWVMVIVTFFTFLYLVKTFRAQSKSLESQLIVQKAQQQATEIEQKRYMAEIRPDISYSLDFAAQEFTFTPINKELRNLKYSTSQMAKNIIDYNNIKDQPPFTYVLNNPIILKYKWPSNNIDFLLFSIDLTFQDELDNDYEIKVAISNDGRAFKIGPMQPKK